MPCLSPIDHRRTALIAILAMALAFATPLVAAASPLSALTVILTYETAESGFPKLAVTGRLPEDATLPAQIVLPVPGDSNIAWAGELFLDAERENIPVDAAVEVRDGVSVVAFTLTESRLGHVEVTYPGLRSLVSAVGATYETGFDITLPGQTGPIYAAISLPPGAEPMASPDLMALSEEADGRRYYFSERPAGEAGDSLSLTMQVNEGRPDDELFNEVSPIVVGGVFAVIAGAALLYFASRKRPGTGPTGPA